METMESWMSIEFDVQKWVWLLKHVGCDMRSVQQLFLLAQISPAGAVKANNIVFQVMKKWDANEHVASYSRYVQGSALSARRQLEGDMYGW